MKNAKWLLNRMKAMMPQEVAWRIQQKLLQKREYNTIYRLHLPVTEIPLDKPLCELYIHVDRLGINWDNQRFSEFDALDLFGAFDYPQYRDQWNAGFQTDAVWPECDFTYFIPTTQRTDIGDIRTSWELSRHFQFSALAKSFYATGNRKYLVELEYLFDSWNCHNLFLHGVQWASAMEVAIRINSWVYMYAFLTKSAEKFGGVKQGLLDEIQHGILVMTEYVVKHRARYSSANNHLIIEMYAVALTGIVCDHKPWEQMALRILTEELPKQNSSDGVNKEMSLHYQGFVMEAYGLLALLLKKNCRNIPDIWMAYLHSMSRFVADSCGDFGEVVVFGDNDEGKLLDLRGRIADHYRYVLGLMSCLLDMRYVEMRELHENLLWVVPEQILQESLAKPAYRSGRVCCYREGGYTFLRSADRRILIGIDHAALGFGNIAAHGHADGLSFQMFVEGVPVFVDAGTFNYHVTPEDRDYFRSTAAHNTVSIDGMNQSQIQGPFLWGKKADTKLCALRDKQEELFLEMECSYFGKQHKRILRFDNIKLTIEDSIDGGTGEMHLQLSPEVGLRKISSQQYELTFNGCMLLVSFDSPVEIIEQRYSSAYNSQQSISVIKCRFTKKQVTRIEIQG